MTHQVEIWNRQTSEWQIFLVVVDKRIGEKVIERELANISPLRQYGWVLPGEQHFRLVPKAK